MKTFKGTKRRFHNGKIVGVFDTPGMFQLSGDQRIKCYSQLENNPGVFFKQWGLDDPEAEDMRIAFPDEVLDDTRYDFSRHNQVNRKKLSIGKRQQEGRKMRFAAILLSILALISNAPGKTDFRANRDFLILFYTVDGIIQTNEKYLNAHSDEKRTEYAIIENTLLFRLWLMYVGPWRFDLSGNTEAQRYLQKMPGGFGAKLLQLKLSDDPLGIMNNLKAGDSIKKLLPKSGVIPNLNTEAIHSLEDYRNLVDGYKSWLIGGYKQFLEWKQKHSLEHN